MKVVELNDKILSKLAEATAAVTESCGAFSQIISPKDARATTVGDVEAAENLAWEAHQRLAGLMSAHDQVLRSLRLTLVSAGASGWREEAGSVFHERVAAAVD